MNSRINRSIRPLVMDPEDEKNSASGSSLRSLDRNELLLVTGLRRTVQQVVNVTNAEQVAARLEFDISTSTWVIAHGFPPKHRQRRQAQHLDPGE